MIDGGYWTRLNRRMSRRRALAAAAGGSAGLAAIALAGCGGDEGGSAASGTPSQGASETPKKGGVATIVFAGQADTYDPHIGVVVGSKGYGLYDTLLLFDADTLDPLPNVITKWEYADPTTLVLHVRDGVKYYDKPPANGRLLTAEDIAYGLNRAKTPDPQFLFNSRFQAIDSVKATDGKTVQVKLKAPSAAVLSFIGSESIINRESIEAAGGVVKDPRQVISVGPFMCTEFQPGVAGKFVRNPNYWDAGKPYLDGLNWTIIADRGALIAAYRTGDIDFGGSQAGAVDATEKKQLEQSSSTIQFVKSIQSFGSLFLTNNEKPPLNDVRVRKAIDLVSDRPQLVDLVRGGAAAPAGVLWDGYMPGYGIPDKELLARPGYRQPKDQDIAEAKKLLEAAGFPNGLDLPADGSEYNKALNLDPVVSSVQQFAKAGIKLHVDQLLDAAGLLDSDLKGTYRFRARGIGAAPEPGDQLRTRLYSKSPRNYVHYKNADIDRMIDQQDTVLDTKQRQDLIVKIQRQAMDDVPYVFLIWPWEYVVVQPWLRGVKIGSLGSLVTKDWWRAKP